MSSYCLDFSAIGSVKVTKKRGMKSMRLRINPRGEIVVSAPWHVPKSVVISFIRERQEWLLKNKSNYSLHLRNGMQFGNNLQLHLNSGAVKNSSVVASNKLVVRLVGSRDPANPKQQAYIESKIITAMQAEAENILLPRLYDLSTRTKHTFNQAYVKRLSSRWGSCDQEKNIILNVFLLQLPPALQEYVMLHELTHTRYMHHGKDFWDHMKSYLPHLNALKKELKKHHPRIEERI